VHCKVEYITVVWQCLGCYKRNTPPSFTAQTESTSETLTKEQDFDRPFSDRCAEIALHMAHF
jgi:hypothetical protein